MHTNLDAFEVVVCSPHCGVLLFVRVMLEDLLAVCRMRGSEPQSHPCREGSHMHIRDGWRRQVTYMLSLRPELLPCTSFSPALAEHSDPGPAMGTFRCFHCKGSPISILHYLPLSWIKQ